MPGEHNILNAVGAFACCHQLGVAPAVIIDTLDKFKGTQRRFDIVGTTSDGVKLVDDYAHHPTEIKATLSAAHNIPHNRLFGVSSSRIPIRERWRFLMTLQKRLQKRTF